MFAGLGALILGLPNLLLRIAYFRRFSDAQPEQPDASEAEKQLDWPLWHRCLCFVSALVVIGWGGYAILTQTFYLNRGSSSSGIEITGIAAVMIGLVLASFGTVFLLYCLFPQHKIWSRGARKRA